MPAPRSNNGRYFVPKANFKAGSGGSSYVFWSESGHMYSWHAGTSNYIQIEETGNLVKLATYVDEQVQDLEDRLAKLETASAKGGDEKEGLESMLRAEMASLAAENETALAAVKASIASVMTFNSALETCTNDKMRKLERACAETSEKIEVSVKSLESSIDGKVRGLEVAVFGLSLATHVAERHMSEASAAERKALETVEKVQVMVADGIPGVDPAPAKEAYAKTQIRASELVALHKEAQSLDTSAKAAGPDMDLELRFDVLQTQLMKDLTASVVEPVDARLSELATLVAKLKKAAT